MEKEAGIRVDTTRGLSHPVNTCKASLLYVTIFLSVGSLLMYFITTDLYSKRNVYLQPVKWTVNFPKLTTAYNKPSQNSTSYSSEDRKKEPKPKIPTNQKNQAKAGVIEEQLNQTDLRETQKPKINSTQATSPVSGKPKLVLSWTPVPGMDYMTLRTYKKPEFKSLGCPISNCIYTEDKSLADKSDAIVFIARSLGKKPKKLPHQRWVWVTHESSCNSGENGGVWEGMFNWTMTFRRDSDIFAPWFFLKKRDKPLIKNFTEITLKKTKMVAWFVSNCNTQSRREDYVRELQKYIKVDIYGNCGPLKCSKRENEKCEAKMKKEYKFYLSFENSISTDYISDKFWKTAGQNIVPITRGSPANYSRVGIQPSWHISTNDFKSPKDLAHYLHYLANNVTAYVKYLEWKSVYDVDLRLKSYCELCAKLNDPSEPVTWYAKGKLAEWFNKGHCLPPSDLNFKGNTDRKTRKR
ncbi:alpha-(1,3)-fucosyltransferase fut-1-like [Lingula anatina]|uniref:Fucosyltransferase n=1 Tax=Lingula anatina TaxID=7574 RepID=A0A2R2MP89_LINAN|nr:alpha-(1,3)-fucosyltransferase fut-1-like [Lingula anatina]|eukprot:XP_023932051.1 alpha-(1,3)-fucosyltransferase fut-1-like [Lingula anatina]